MDFSFTYWYWGIFFLHLLTRLEAGYPFKHLLWSNYYSISILNLSSHSCTTSHLYTSAASASPLIVVGSNLALHQRGYSLNRTHMCFSFPLVPIVSLFVISTLVDHENFESLVTRRPRPTWRTRTRTRGGSTNALMTTAAWTRNCMFIRGKSIVYLWSGVEK
jgi:hypothetical protein